MASHKQSFASLHAAEHSTCYHGFVHNFCRHTHTRKGIRHRAHSSAKPIVVLGSINIDLAISLQRLPQPGETVSASSLQRFAGGKVSTSALAQCHHGNAVYHTVTMAANAEHLLKVFFSAPCRVQIKQRLPRSWIAPRSWWGRSAATPELTLCALLSVRLECL